MHDSIVLQRPNACFVRKLRFGFRRLTWHAAVASCSVHSLHSGLTGALPNGPTWLRVYNWVSNHWIQLITIRYSHQKSALTCCRSAGLCNIDVYSARKSISVSMLMKKRFYKGTVTWFYQWSRGLKRPYSPENFGQPIQLHTHSWSIIAQTPQLILIWLLHWQHTKISLQQLHT